MKQRRQKSGGQAIVMVTMALFAMCGMMGLAVDLGWSFFVQKEAQASADGAAMAAVHEAYEVLGGTITGLSSCPSTIDCTTTSQQCSGIASTSNLYNGCLYAKSNGFNWDTDTAHTNVAVTTGFNTPPPDVSGVNNIVYWVTVSASQTIPQLFSSLAGNTNGTVSAVATAGIVAQVFPGSFLGMNRESDCQTTAAGSAVDCGVDMDLGGAGSATCNNSNGTASGYSASVCGPAGIYLASQCNGTGTPSGCTDSGGNSGAFAGMIAGHASVWGSTTQIRGTGNVQPCSASTTVCPTAGSTWQPTVTNGHNGSQFVDPDSGVPQPKVAPGLASTPLTPCPVPDNNGATATISGTNLGPFQYYAVNKAGVADGHPLALTGSPIFSTSGTCPSNVSLTSNNPLSTFGTYVFYGGVDISSTSSSTFGPGQYVFAGTASPSGYVLYSDKAGTITGNSSTGTMFIFTDANYPGLTVPPDITTLLAGNTSALVQGGVYFKNTPGTLTGISDSLPGSAAALDQYGGVLFWQDDRNTSLKASGYYDSTDTWTSCGTAPCGPPSSYHSTNTSPEMVLDHGNGSLTLTGVIHQPRGAWLQLNAGGAAVANSPLQVLTGALTFGTGGGNAQVVLLGLTKPTVIYRTALIQ